jgi:tetratricopeptide (TPR) repeat protein
MSFPAFYGTIHIFFSYATTAPKDKNLFSKLKTHLSSLKRRELIDDPCDSESATRNNSEESIETSINQADISVLLISPEFLDSERCYKIEMKRALERSRAREARLILVLLHPTVLKGTPLEEYSLLPSNSKPVSLWSSIDAALLEVANEIGKTAEELVGLKELRSYPETPFPLDMIPYGHNPFFTDRTAILASLHNYFSSSKAFRQTCIQALNGMVGIGKTQIAVEYAHLYKHEYQAILWLEAASRTLLNEGIISLAEQLSLAEQDLIDEQHRFSAFKRWLQLQNKWLLILDNLEDVTLIEQFIPLQSNGHVLLTTLAQATGHLAHAIPVAQMTTEDSALFLLRRAKFIEEQASRSKTSETDFIQATSIAQEVGELSLALDQAGAYIEETGCGLARYLQLYRRQGSKLLAERGQLAHVHPNSVTVTLSLTFEKVTRARPDVLKLLQLFAFLHPDAIPDEIIERGAPTLEGALHELGTDPFALDKAIALLLKYSLVQRRTDTTTLSIHRVVQAILKEKLTAKQRRQWTIRVVRLVNSIFPEAEFSNWSTCEKYFAQARHCANLILNFHLIQKEATDLLLHLGSYCYQRAYYQDAEKYLTDALELCEQGIGPDQPDTAWALHSLAGVYQKQGRYQEAEKHYQRTLVIREQAWGSEHSLVAQTLNNLALLYKDWGKYQQAETLYLRVLTTYEHTIGLEHPDTAASLSNLALVYDELGKHSQATALYQRAFSIEESTLSAQHPDLALSLNILASRYEDQGEYQQAEVLYQRTLALQEQVVGPEHPDTAQSLNNLAGLYEVQKRFQEAEILYQRALHICEKVLGPEHLETARVLNNLAYLSRQQGHYQNAETLYQRALRIYEKASGPEHPDIVSILNNLGKLYHLMKKDELAEPLLRRGLDICEHVLDGEHLDTSRSLTALIDLLIEQHRYEEAEPLYRRVLKIIQQAFGPEHPDVALALEEYNILLDRINKQGKL